MNGTGEHMRRVKFPHCVKCDGEINPIKYDDCEKYYLTYDGVMCKYCFLDDSRDWLESNLDEFAELVGVPVVEVENG